MPKDFNIDDTPTMMKNETEELLSLRDEVAKLKSDLSFAQQCIRSQVAIILAAKLALDNA